MSLCKAECPRGYSQIQVSLSGAKFLQGGLGPRTVATCQMQLEGSAAGAKSASAAGSVCLKHLSSSLPLAA